MSLIDISEKFGSELSVEDRAELFDRVSCRPVDAEAFNVNVHLQNLLTFYNHGRLSSDIRESVQHALYGAQPTKEGVEMAVEGLVQETISSRIRSALRRAVTMTDGQRTEPYKALTELLQASHDISEGLPYAINVAVGKEAIGLESAPPTPHTYYAPLVAEAIISYVQHREAA